MITIKVITPNKEIDGLIKDIIDEIKDFDIFNTKDINFSKVFNKIGEDINKLIKNSDKSNTMKKDVKVKNNINIDNIKEQKKEDDYSNVLNIEHVI